MFNNPFRSNKIFLVVVQTFLDNVEVKELKQKRSFLRRHDAATYAQNQCFYSGRKQVVARIYAL